MPHQLFTGGLQARATYPELKKYFYRDHSNITWEEFLTTKFGLSKKDLRLVMVTLHATCLTLKMQWHTLVSPVPEIF